MSYSKSTEGQTEIHKLYWSMTNINDTITLPDSKAILIQNSEEPGNDEFTLKMQFLGRDNDFIELYYLSPRSAFLKIELSVSNRSLTKEYHTVPGKKWQYLIKLLWNEIIRHNAYNLHLNCKFMVTSNHGIDHFHTSEAALGNDLANILNNGMLSDITMRSADGKDYKVHKLILSSRSVILKAHFLHNTTECNTNSIESPFEADVLDKVITFIYTDKAPWNNDIPEKVLVAADYYQLARLKAMCEESLYEKLTEENAIETLELADLHSARNLKQMTMEYIKDGRAKLVTRTEKWTKFNSVKLIKGLYEFIASDKLDSSIPNNTEEGKS